MQPHGERLSGLECSHGCLYVFRRKRDQRDQNVTLFSRVLCLREQCVCVSQEREIARGSKSGSRQTNSKDDNTMTRRFYSNEQSPQMRRSYGEGQGTVFIEIE